MAQCHRTRIRIKLDRSNIQRAVGNGLVGGEEQLDGQFGNRDFERHVDAPNMPKATTRVRTKLAIVRGVFTCAGFSWYYVM
jgi:hypothetical protein